jgi:hypothetical protein
MLDMPHLLYRNSRAITMEFLPMAKLFETSFMIREIDTTINESTKCGTIGGG